MSGHLQARIGDVCHVIAGQSPPGSAINASGEGVPFYQGKKDFTDRFIGPPTAWTRTVTKKAQAGDVLMSVRAPVGPVNVATESICIGRGLAAIRASDRLDSGYLFYALKGLEKSIQGTTGAVFASINKKQISEIVISVPPLDEQRRIVERLNEAMNHLDAIERICCDRSDLEAVVTSSLLSESFRVSNDSPVMHLEDVVDVIIDHRGKTPGKLGGAFLDEGVPVLSAANIKDGEIQRPEGGRFISNAMYERWMPEPLQEGDVLLTSEAPLGRVAQVGPDCGFALGQRLFGLRTRPSIMDSRFLRFFLQSREGQEQLHGRQTGATAVGIRQSELRKIRIPVPSIAEQVDVVARAEAAESSAKQLREISERKGQLVNALRHVTVRHFLGSN